MKKSFIFGAIASVLCLCNAEAAMDMSGRVSVQKTCPAGCFCLKGGRFVDTGNTAGGPIEDVCANGYVHTMETLQESIAYANMNYGCFGTIPQPNDELIGVLTSSAYSWPALGSCSFYTPTQILYLDEFSEIYWDYTLGFYGIKYTGEVVHFSAYNSTQTSMLDNIFKCPPDYPNSDPGASAVTDCYGYYGGGRSGKKVYYSPTAGNNNQLNKEVSPLLKSDTTSKKINSGLKSNKGKIGRSVTGEPRMVKKIVYEQVVEDDDYEM